MPDDNKPTPIHPIKPDPVATTTTIKSTITEPSDPVALAKGGISKPKKVWYKNPWFWVGVGALVVGIIAITLGLIYRNNVIKNQQTISDGWHAVVAEANTTLVLSEKVKTTDSYADYSKELHKFNQLLNDKKYAADKMPTFLSNGNAVEQYRGFLEGFNNYIGDAATQSDTVSDFTTADMSRLSDLSNSARNVANTLKNNNSYLSESMPDKIYDIAATLDTIKNQIDTKNSEAKAAKDAAAANATKDAADKQTVENNTTQFLTGFVAGNASVMRKYMTQAYQNEFDFNQLSAESRASVYPASFRIILSKKQEDGNYKVTANVTYKYRDNPSQYVNGYEYVLIPTSGSVGWLINTEKVGAGY